MTVAKNDFCPEFLDHELAQQLFPLRCECVDVVHTSPCMCRGPLRKKSFGQSLLEVPSGPSGLHTLLHPEVQVILDLLSYPAALECLATREFLVCPAVQLDQYQEILEDLQGLDLPQVLQGLQVLAHLVLPQDLACLLGLAVLQVLAGHGHRKRPAVLQLLAGLARHHALVVLFHLVVLAFLVHRWDQAAHAHPACQSLHEVPLVPVLLVLHVVPPAPEVLEFLFCPLDPQVPEDRLSQAGPQDPFHLHPLWVLQDLALL
mmetsp:Transcript_33981/g.60094  ORF Transcript_33981/g.60094 Transcript_33981/m.60094 type:complete len:260 (+) Transcript_33981:285-1064(+)